MFGDPYFILVLLPVILIAITVHEFSHAYAADKLGDATARLEGRLTLNPIAHLDPIGTLCLFIAHFGWGKPVPVNSRNFRHPLRDDMIVSACGPMSNLITALVIGIILQVSVENSLIPARSYLFDFLRMGLIINLSLCFFNLLPLYPLDGSHILRGLLPRNLIPQYEHISGYSPFILLGLIALGPIFHVPVFRSVLGTPIFFFARLFTSIL
ncbi:MAG: site-2 protease family protein [Candidatus Brocadiales bacterium]|nr:site-2 protease family protein [Candidatus Bathyanammoxibius amoris]